MSKKPAIVNRIIWLRNLVKKLRVALFIFSYNVS